MGNREKFKKTYIEGLKAILVGNSEVRDINIKLFTDKIGGMSDSELDNFIEALEKKEILLPIIVPNGSNAIDFENNMNLIENLGVALHKRVAITRDGVTTMGPIPRLIMEVPLKKPLQLLEKKRSIPADQNSKNILTNQVTSSSKSMSVTSPEIPLMMANGQYYSIREAVKYRGGDTNAELVLEKMADMGLDIDQNVLEQYSSGPEVNNTLKQILFSMHLDMRLIKEN
jgi:hypothetical protein